MTIAVLAIDKAFYYSEVIVNNEKKTDNLLEDVKAEDLRKYSIVSRICVDFVIFIVWVLKGEIQSPFCKIK